MKFKVSFKKSVDLGLFKIHSTGKYILTANNPKQAEKKALIYLKHKGFIISVKLHSNN